VPAEEVDEPEVVAVVEEAQAIVEEVEAEAPTASVIPLAASTARAAGAADAETMNALHARVERLEARVAEQDADLRRVLALVTDWVEKDNQSLAAEIRNIRAA
jgi:general secretion pathway protein A